MLHDVSRAVENEPVCMKSYLPAFVRHILRCRVPVSSGGYRIVPVSTDNFYSRDTCAIKDSDDAKVISAISARLKKEPGEAQFF